MKITVVLAALLFTGCAHISDYNQGCRDGISAANGEYKEKDRDKLCNDLDRLHKDEKESHK